MSDSSERQLIIGGLEDRVETLTADNARLRAIIKDVESGAAPPLADFDAMRAHVEAGGNTTLQPAGACPWCNRYPCQTSPGGHKDCQAFTDAGEVK